MSTKNGLLASDEPDAFEIIGGDQPIIFVCDHASNRVPSALGDMGLPERYWSEHIARDIGAAELARSLSQRFDGVAILGNYSRLVVDLNRSLQDASAFPVISDGILIPGNLSLTSATKRERAEALFHPYHDAIDDLILAHSSAQMRPILVAVHSFTPQFHRTQRPWDVGVLWDRDPRIALPMLAALRAMPNLAVGDNEPYSGRHPADYSIDTHAEARGIAHIGLEIRQDLIAETSGQERWANILAAALQTVLADSRVFSPHSAAVGG